MPYGSLLPQLGWRIFLPTSAPKQIAPPQPIGGWPTSLRPLITHSERFRNVDRMSITYAFRPRLRTRLTLSGLTLLRKPWVFGVRVSRPHSRYSFRHNHFCFVQHTLSVHLHPRAERSPTRRACARIRSFGGRLESRTLSAQDPLTSELLRTL